MTLLTNYLLTYPKDSAIYLLNNYLELGLVDRKLILLMISYKIRWNLHQLWMLCTEWTVERALETKYNLMIIGGGIASSFVTPRKQQASNRP